MLSSNNSAEISRLAFALVNSVFQYYCLQNVLGNEGIILIFKYSLSKLQVDASKCKFVNQNGLVMGGQTVKNLRRLVYEFEFGQSPRKSARVGDQTKRLANLFGQSLITKLTRIFFY